MTPFNIITLTYQVIKDHGQLMTFQVPYYIQQDYGLKPTTAQCRYALKKLKDEGSVENVKTSYKKQLCWKQRLMNDHTTRA